MQINPPAAHRVGFSPTDPTAWRPANPSIGVRHTRRSRCASVGHVVIADGDDDRVVTFDSGLERRAIEVLATDPSIKTIIEQPVTVEYRDGDNLLRHTFDLMAIGFNGFRDLIAMKHSSRVESSDIHRVVRLIAAQLSRDVADRIVVMTEKDFSRTDYANAQLIREVRREPQPQHDDVVRAASASIMGKVTIRDLAEATDLPPADAFRAVVRCIADGALSLATPGTPIDNRTLVRRAGV